VDHLLIIADDHTPLSAAGADNGSWGGTTTRLAKAAANHANIRQGYCCAA